MSKKLIAGNWKMNGTKSYVSLIDELVLGVKALDTTKFDMVICPPFTMVAAACSLTAPSVIEVGGQDCHQLDSGAYTGNVSADMLVDLGCKYVIVGHSERRQYEKESSALIAEKAGKAIEKGLVPIICVGETDAEREAGKTLEVIDRQVRESLPAGATADNCVIAYEPVWAIGTGKTASIADIKEVHDSIVVLAATMGLAEVKVLYGGSVKPETAEETLGLKCVGGVLVGGASLNAASFLAIAAGAK